MRLNAVLLSFGVCFHPTSAVVLLDGWSLFGYHWSTAP